MNRHLRLHWVLKRLSDATGTNLLEAAAITPLLLLLTFSIVDFASIFYVYLALENGVSQATRYGVTGNTMNDPITGQPLSHVDSMKLVMRQSTPTLTIADTAFTFSHMPTGTTNWIGGDGGPSDLEKVQVDYDWTVMTPLLRPFFTNGVFHVTVDSAMKNEPRFQ